MDLVIDKIDAIRRVSPAPISARSVAVVLVPPQSQVAITQRARADFNAQANIYVVGQMGGNLTAYDLSNLSEICSISFKR